MDPNPLTVLKRFECWLYSWVTLAMDKNYFLPLPSKQINWKIPTHVWQRTQTSHSPGQRCSLYLILCMSFALTTVMCQEFCCLSKWSQKCSWQETRVGGEGDDGISLITDSVCRNSGLQQNLIHLYHFGESPFESSEGTSIGWHNFFLADLYFTWLCIALIILHII